MSIERLKEMKNKLMNAVETQMSNLDCVDTKELGEAIDMIKDLEEAIYHCYIIKAMEQAHESENGETVNNTYYYGSNYPVRYLEMYRYMDKGKGQMYYEGSDHHEPMGHVYETAAIRDPREGKSSLRRKMYMEGKEIKRSKDQQMKELEAYMQELSTDVTEMIKDASPEEKAILRQKMTTLASKIA